MKKLESSLLNMTLVLTLVAVVMGGILRWWQSSWVASSPL